MHQEGGGHFSPVAAYVNQDGQEQFLFMDLSSYKKWGSVWVNSNTLCQAMNTKDGDNDRGYIIDILL